MQKINFVAIPIFHLFISSQQFSALNDEKAFASGSEMNRNESPDKSPHFKYCRWIWNTFNGVLSHGC